MIKIKIPIDAFSELSVFLQSHEQDIAEKRENYELLKWVFECVFEREPKPTKFTERAILGDTVFNSGLIKTKE